MTMSFVDYLCLLNPDRDVAFGKKFQQLDGVSFDMIVDFFKQRMDDFFLEPCKAIMKSITSGKETNTGFVVISLCCTLIDVLSSCVDPKKMKIGKRFVNFLVNWSPREFNQSFKNNRIIFYYDRKGKLTNSNSAKMSYAKVVWYQFRCSVVHNASFGLYGGYDFGQSNLFEEYPWIDWKGRGRVDLGVNPDLFVKKIEDIFKDYIKKLKDPSNIDLRKKFNCKILKDFGLKYK